MERAIIIDLDGTLCNCEHRRKLKSTGKIDFGHFLDPENIAKDPVNDWCRELIKGMFSIGYTIIFVSGREDTLRNATINWLGENRLLIYPPQIFMREEGDYRKDFEVKKEIYEDHIKFKYEILFIVDDRKQVVDMWRGEGLTVLHCADGNF